MGRAAGFGFEWAVWKNTTFKAEYLHIDLGDQNLFAFAQQPASGTGFLTTKFDNSFEVVRAGLNVRF